MRTEENLGVWELIFAVKVSLSNQYLVMFIGVETTLPILRKISKLDASRDF